MNSVSFRNRQPETFCRLATELSHGRWWASVSVTRTKEPPRRDRDLMRNGPCYPEPSGIVTSAWSLVSSLHSRL
jgi:hypothetical protein